MGARATIGTLVVLAAGACTPHYQVTYETGAAPGDAPADAAAVTRDAVPDAAPDATPVAPPADAPPPNPWTDRELPFEPSDGDRPFLGTGFTGYAPVPEDTGYTQGVRVAGVQPKQALAIAGMQDGDVIVAFGGHRLEGPKDDLIQELRDVLQPMAPDSLTSLAYWREGAGVREIDLWLGRSPPSFAQLATPDDWFSSVEGVETLRDPDVDTWIAAALDLDGGRDRALDTQRRHRERFADRDAFRLRESVVAQSYPSAQERIAARLLERVRLEPAAAAAIAAGTYHSPPAADEQLASQTVWVQLVDVLEERLVRLDRRLREHLAAWSDDERRWLAENVHVLSQRGVVDCEYLYGDEDVGRERTNRRVVELLSRVDRAELASTANAVSALVHDLVPTIVRLAGSDEREGLLVARDTPAGRIEIWGRGGQTHTTRCLFRYDHDGDDRYLDVGGRADLDQPISISVDHAGNDLYGATTPFGQGGALGGVGILIDLAGDDQYLGTQWCQGAALAGFGLLEDRAGNDTYRGREACQGVALVGGAVLRDDAGDDTYSGDRFCQGVGMAGGIGVIQDAAGDDRYSCTGRYPSEYGEPGLFSGWGQGVGYGFRHVTSGGIGILHDVAGDDVYEAGNFSQGGGYFYGWGVFRDDAGADRYIGSRYAQGYAAHQAAGTFVDGGGDDVYTSYSSVAQGLSWDETSVFFRDRGGNDDYRSSGFSLASAAHNGMVIFVDDEGDDRYASLPAKASSNTYHGGWSFALFVDRAGHDTYHGHRDENVNGRALFRHEGAYFLDLDGDRPVEDLVRDVPEKD